MQTVADVREKLFTIRMNDDETARLEMLAEHFGLTAAGVVRMLLKREADLVASQKAQEASASEHRAKADAALQELKDQFNVTPWGTSKPKTPSKKR